MTIAYADFIARRKARIYESGPAIAPGDLHHSLKPFQVELVIWAARVGRAAIWADTGLGKTRMQLEWARSVAETALIVAPLAVAQQTIAEAAKIDIDARYVRSPEQITGPGVYVTNYEMVEKFPAAMFGAVVLDEASILKQSDGKTRTRLIEHFKDVPFRLACTATPAPNDPEELTNQAEFLGQMTRTNMLAAYFVHDQDGWRLKGHAYDPLIAWMTTWAVAVRRPSDMGYADDGYILPGLELVTELVEAEIEAAPDELFSLTIGGVSDRARVRRSTIAARVARAVELAYDCGPQGVQPGVLRISSGEVQEDAGAERAPQRVTSEEVRREFRDAHEDLRAGQEVTQSPTAPEVCSAVRDQRRGNRADDESGMLGLPREPDDRPNGAPAYRSQSHDGHGARCSLSELQHSAGSVEGGPDQDRESSELPHACRDQWLFWVGLNAEQDALAKAFGDDCVSIDGRDSIDQKIAKEFAWRNGDVRILITKHKVFGYGMNWQHCARMAFVGLSDSYEAYYQCIRRCYRYGQTRIVRAHIVLSPIEDQIAANVARKEKQANRIVDGMVRAIRKAS